MITIDENVSKKTCVGKLKCGDTFEHNHIYYIVVEVELFHYHYVELETGANKYFFNQDCLVQPVDLIMRVRQIPNE